jgi:hypothetical protein
LIGNRNFIFGEAKMSAKVLEFGQQAKIPTAGFRSKKLRLSAANCH